MTDMVLPSSIQFDFRLIKAINATKFRRWVLMLAIAAENAGVIPAEIMASLPWRLHITAKQLKETLDLFERPHLRLIERQEDGSVAMLDYQPAGTSYEPRRAMTPRERKAKERALAAEAKANGGISRPTDNVTKNVTSRVTRRVTNGTYQSRNGHGDSRTRETLTFDSGELDSNSPNLKTLNVGENVAKRDREDDLTSLFFEDKASAIGAVVELTGDTHSIRRWGQLWDLCHKNGLLPLFVEAYDATCLHLDREPDGNGGQYMNGLLADLIRNQGVRLDGGTEEELAEIAEQLQDLKDVLAADLDTLPADPGTNGKGDAHQTSENVTKNVTLPQHENVTKNVTSSAEHLQAENASIVPIPPAVKLIRDAWTTLDAAEKETRLSTSRRKLKRRNIRDERQVLSDAQQTYWDDLRSNDLKSSQTATA